MSGISFNVGRLNTRLTLQTSTGTKDTYGQEIEEWEDYMSMWAEKVDESSREFYAAQKVHAETTAVYKIHYMKTLEGQNIKLMRIKTQDKRYLNIISADDVNNRHICIVIKAKEVE